MAPAVAHAPGTPGLAARPTDPLTDPLMDPLTGPDSNPLTNPLMDPLSDPLADPAPALPPASQTEVSSSTVDDGDFTFAASLPAVDASMLMVIVLMMAMAVHAFAAWLI